MQGAAGQEIPAAAISAEAVRVQPSQRLLSLDVLRGLDVALMILVNDAGGPSYYQLDHAPWNGCTLTDLVFPTFLFMVGVSIVFAYSSRLAKNVSRKDIMLHTMKRAVFIILIGLFFNSAPFFHLGRLRYFGVLQRIGMCYAIAGAIYLFGKVRGSVIAIVLALVGYWFVMTQVPVPGYGMPGTTVHGVTLGIWDTSGASTMAGWVDQQMMSPVHIYQHKGFDPEGLLSTIPAVATTLLGVLVGVWIKTKRSVERKAAWLAGVGVVLIGAGLLWSNSFPINKRMWTSSYVLFVGGIAMVALALLYFVIDRKPREAGAKTSLWMKPWLVYGSNALTAYVIADALAITLGDVHIAGKSLHGTLFHLLPLSLGPIEIWSLVYALLFDLACFLPILVLYRKKIFLRL